MLVLEAEEQVGGLAKTVEIDGYRFDLGGHRFFTKSLEVDTLWHDILGDEFLLRPRMSRIYWSGRYLDYPLRGATSSASSAPSSSRAAWRRTSVRPCARTRSTRRFEDWVTNRFGKRLFELFFKSYTEKLWGVPTHRDSRRVGRPADQGPLVLLRCEGGVLRQQGEQGEEPDLRVPLPALRPGPDVGRDDAPRSRRRAARCAPAPGRPDRARRRPGRRGRGGRRVVPAARRRRLVPAAARDRADGAPARRRRRSSTRRSACATATS